MTQALHNHVIGNLPRLLSQLDRDCDSPTFGSFDRDFWHYKIRDFSSAILQQSAVSLFHLPNLMPIDPQSAGYWLKGVLGFWSRLPTRGGALNEYYPWEGAYPPTAFSLQAVGQILLKDGTLASESIERQAKRCCDYLLRHFEDDALNQQAAGLCALAIFQKIGWMKDDAKLENIAERFFQAQNQEGWFPEYGGPDLGYLSVTLDMLWDYFEVSQDFRAMEAMNKAVDFMAHFVDDEGRILTIANSRETDYMVPYALVRLGQKNPKAAWLVRRVFGRCDMFGHFLKAVDDRYNTHYIFNSCVKALPFWDLMTEDEYLPGDFQVYFKESGILADKQSGRLFIIAGKKGGACMDNATLADFGWRCQKDKKIWVSNVQNSAYNIEWKGSAFSVEGYLTPGSWMLSSPWKHLALRALSFFGAWALIPSLKAKMIFKQPDRQFQFLRTFDFATGNMDTIIEGEGRFEAWKADKQSIRHVASAFSFSVHDFWHLPRKTFSADGILKIREVINGS